MQAASTLVASTLGTHLQRVVSKESPTTHSSVCTQAPSSMAPPSGAGFGEPASTPGWGWPPSMLLSLPEGEPPWSAPVSAFSLAQAATSRPRPASAKNRFLMGTSVRRSEVAKHVPVSYTHLRAHETDSYL